MKVRRYSKFLKSEDVNDGDIIVINDEGTEEDGQFGKKYNFTVIHDGVEKKLSFNATSMGKLIEAWGDESEKWVSKEAKVHKVKQNVAGKMKSVLYVTAPEQTLGDE